MFSHPGLSAVPKVATSAVDKSSRPLPNQFTVTISGTVPPGLYEVRTVGPTGISNPRTFAVGTLNEVVDREPADKLKTAKEVPLESNVNATMQPERADYFKFAAKKGQRVLVEAWARRIDSRLDPRLVIYDATGHELARGKERFHRDRAAGLHRPGRWFVCRQNVRFSVQGGLRLLLSTDALHRAAFGFRHAALGHGGNKVEIHAVRPQLARRRRDRRANRLRHSA